MNQEEANKQIHQLGVLVLLDAPEKIQLGIDNTFWIVGSKFKGMKLIPLGPHYVHYALADEKYQFKLGFFCIFSKEKRIIVRKWHPKYEDFLPVDEDEYQKYEHAVKINDLDPYLGPYPYEKWEVWQQVTNYITKPVLDKLDPIVPQVYTIQEEYGQQKQETNNQKQDDGMDMEESDEDEALEGEELQQSYPQQDDQNISNSDPYSFNMEAEMSESQDQQSQNNPQMRTDQQIKSEAQNHTAKENFQVMAGTVYYTDIPQRKVKHGSKGSDLTKMNFDKSQILADLITKEYKGDYKVLLGELQYAFVKFLIGENYEAFEQWKKLFILVTSCEDYVDENPQFYADLIPVLYGQLQQVPKDFFIDKISHNNFVIVCLTHFFEICSGNYTGERKKVAQRALKLKQLIEQNFELIGEGLELDDDEAPIIVENFEFVQI